jgi:hypothetical protein
MTIDVGTSPKFNNEAERNNWMACRDALENFDSRTLEVVKDIYRPGDTIPDKVYNLSKELKITQDSIWNMINTLERNVAKRRGLI